MRGGYGLYFNTNNQQNLIVTVTNPPATPRFVIAEPDVPDAAVRARRRQHDPAGAVGPRRTRGSTCGTSALQRALPASFVATIGYAGSRGTHLFRNTDVNIPTPTPAPDGRLFFAAGPAAAQSAASARSS